jgi:exopolysaccharide biosynthesis polyprenyl glycosylphosphotransferase
MKSLTQFKKFFLLTGDIIILYAALYLTLVFRYQALPSGFLWQSHFVLFTIVFTGWILIFYIANLYDLRLAVNNARFWQITGKSLLVATLIAVVFFYLLPNSEITPKTNLAIYLVVFTFLFGLWRNFFNWSLSAYLPKNNIAVVGWNDQVKELVDEMSEKKQLGYRLAFILDDRTTEQNNYRDVPIWREVASLPELVKNHKVSAIIVSSDPDQSTALRSALFACLPLKISFFALPLFYESFSGKVPVSLISEMWFLENLNEGGQAIFDTIKRTADFLLALIFFLVTLPFWPLVGIIIKLDSRGPVFFLQTRVGTDGKLFRIYKFRTMREAGNDHVPTIANDKRVTRFGNFLRKSRIDEIPQLLNIIKGEMSFVGPRPERPELVEDLEKMIPFYRERMLVKPGVTGWDQVSGEYHSPSYEDTLKKLQYDLFYIKNRSIYLDLTIILKTIYTVLSRSGI